MPNKDLILDVSTIDFNKIVASLDEIRLYNPQRFEMEQLTAIVYENSDDNKCVRTRTFLIRNSGFVATCPACR